MEDFTGILLDYGGNPLSSPSSTSTMQTLKKLRNVLTVTLVWSSLLAYVVYFIIQMTVFVFNYIHQAAFMIRYLIYAAIFFVPVIHNGLSILILTLLRKKMANLIKDFHCFERLNLIASTSERFGRIRKKCNRDIVKITSMNLAM